MENKVVFVVLTDSGYWGKSEDIIEAMVNAKVNPYNKLAIAVVITEDYESVGVDNMGVVHYKQGSQCHWAKKMEDEVGLIFDKSDILGYMGDKEPNNNISGKLLDLQFEVTSE